VQLTTLHLLEGLPSAKLGRAAVARNRVIAATASKSFFMVVLLGEGFAPGYLACDQED